MAITIDLPPQMVQEARGYAVLEGMSLEALFLRGLNAELARYRQKKLQPKSFAERWRAAVARSSGRLSAPYKFNRADAYREGVYA